jgi:MoxR-like ATPase
MPLMEPTRHKGMYVDACLREIEEIRAEVIDYRVRLKAHIRSMETDIRTHLWVTPDFVEPAARSLERAQQDVETLLTRVDNVITGFQLLPRERDDLRQVAT